MTVRNRCDRWQIVLAGVWCIAYCLAAGSVGLQAATPPTFEKHAAPFFKTYCLGCHDGGDDSKGGFSVLNYKSLMAGGDGGEAIVAGKVAESRLVQMLLGKEKPRMPPKGSKQPRREEIAAIVRWVESGALGPTTASLQSADELKLPRVAPKSIVAPGVAAVSFSPDGKWLAAARHREVLLFDAGTGALVETLTDAENPVNALAFSPDSRLLAAAEGLPSVVGKVRVWEVGEAAARVFTGHADSIYGLAFSPDGRLLATAGYDKLLILWDVAAGAEKHTLKHHTGAVYGTAFSPDGKTLASVAADQTLKFWNAASGQRISTLSEPTKGLYSVAFAPSGREVAVAGIDKMIRIYEWNGAAARLGRSAFAHDAPIVAINYSPDGATLFTASEDRRVKAWDVTTLRERHVYERLPDWPQALAVDPAGRQVAVGLFDGELLVFDSGAPRVSRELLGRPSVNSTASVGATPAATPAAEANPSSGDPAQARPATPQFNAIAPRTAVRGRTVKLTLSGKNIAAVDRIFVSPSELQVRLLPSDMKKPDLAFCEIAVPADLRPGPVSLRLHTPSGTAGTKSFYVGPFPEVGEGDDNDVPAKATRVELPATLLGSIGARGDRDCWSFAAKAGEELVFVTFDYNPGAVFPANLTLLDEHGTVLQRASRDAARGETVLGHRFSTDGRYVLVVEDRDYTGGKKRLDYGIHAGAFPWVTAAFPLGLRGSDQGQPAPEETTAIAVKGFNVPAETSYTAVKGTGPHVHVPQAPAPTGKALNAARYESSSFAEFVERESNDLPERAQPLPVPAGVSGRIAEHEESGIRSQLSENKGPISARNRSTADVDCYSFEAKRGERLTIETFARRLGSPVDTFIEMLDGKGQPVPRATLRAVAETYTVLRDHNSSSKGIRLQAWDDFRPNDYLLLGGEIIKVQTLPLGPDEDIKFFDRFGIRQGYLGTTPQAHALNSTAYKIEVHPPQIEFSPNGKPTVQLDWLNDDAPGQKGDSQILFDVPADGRYVVRVRDVQQLSREDFVYRLVVRPRHEDFRISLEPENPNIPRGGTLPVTVRVDRLDGFNGHVDVRVAGLPAGLAATTTRIGPDLYTGVLTLTAAEDAPQLVMAEPGVSAPGSTGAPVAPDALSMRVIGSADIGGRQVEQTTAPVFGSHHLTIVPESDLAVSIEPTFAEISPGKQVRFTVSIERRHGAVGRVPIDVLNLPHGLRVLDIGLSGVLINENETSRSFVLACDPWVEPGQIMAHAGVRLEKKTEPFQGAAAFVLEVKSP